MLRIDFSHWFDVPLQGRELALQNYDAIRLIEWGNKYINVTIFNSWLIILLIVGGAWLATRHLSVNKQASRWQIALEALVLWLQKEANETSGSRTNQYLGMAMGLFCFILTANLLTFLPWFRPPTASLSTTMALAAVVFLAIPYFSIRNAGVLFGFGNGITFVRQYVKRRYVRQHFECICAVCSAACHANFGASDRFNSGIYFCFACRGVFVKR